MHSFEDNTAQVTVRELPVGAKFSFVRNEGKTYYVLKAHGDFGFATVDFVGPASTRSTTLKSTAHSAPRLIDLTGVEYAEGTLLRRTASAGHDASCEYLLSVTADSPAGNKYVMGTIVSDSALRDGTPVCAPKNCTVPAPDAMAEGARKLAAMRSSRDFWRRLANSRAEALSSLQKEVDEAYRSGILDERGRIRTHLESGA